jgi:hypothetical protein
MSKKVPCEIIPDLNKSFRDIAKELKIYKRMLKDHPITIEFLKHPYNQTREQVELLDRVWIVLANIVVNNTSNIPSGYGKRILFCTNGGKVFIDTTTYLSGSSKWLNYSTVFGDISWKIRTVDQLSASAIFSTITFNPDETDIEEINTNTNYTKQSTSFRVGSIEPPVLNINNLTPQKTKAVNFQLLENHLTRKEIQDASSKKYGWTSRYSDTIFSPNFYVASTITGADGYLCFVRLSYFKL